MPKCASDHCIEPAAQSLFCAQCEIRERIKIRWDRRIDWNPRLKRLTVHPADWMLMGYPMEYRGLPVKPLSIEFIARTEK